MPHTLTQETYNILVPVFGDHDPHCSDDNRPSDVEQFADSWNSSPSVIAAIARVSGSQSFDDLESVMNEFDTFDEKFVTVLLDIDPTSETCDLYFNNQTIEKLHDDFMDLL